MPEKCPDIRRRLESQLSKYRKLIIIVGFAGLIVGLGFGIAIPALVENPFEEPEEPIDETFTLTISFEDFYVMDNDTLEKNYSYYLHSFQCNGFRLSNTEWDIAKNMNYTQWAIYAQSNVYFVEQALFGVIDSSLNTSIAVDGLEFITNHTFVTMIMDFQLTIYNNDTTYWKEQIYFSLFYFDYFSSDITWDQYPYKSTSGTEDITINVKGCSYNYTSDYFYCAYVDFNGIEKEVLTL